MIDTLRFRRGTISDAQAILTLIESAFRGDSSRQGWTTEADMLEGQRTDLAEVSGLLERADTYFVMAEQNETLLGNVCLTVHDRITHLGMFAVQPSQQSSGLGRALLQRAEQVARTELAAEVMEMSVIAQRTELLAWYVRRGYVATGEVRPFPYGDERVLPQRDDLHFLVLSKKLTAA